MTTAERSAKSIAAWQRLHAEGRAGWTPERRARFSATLALKYPKGDAAARVRADLIGPEIAALRSLVETLTARVDVLEARPALSGEVRIVEWRPDHRREKDGGRPVRLQRREVGLPRRLKAAIA